MVHPLQNFEAAIRQVEIFKVLPPQDQQAIASLGFPRQVESSAYFFHEGDPASHIYILLTGRAKLTKLSPDGQQTNLRTLQPYQLFGAVGAVRPTSPYPASAQALEDCSSIGIESQAFSNLLKERPAVSFGLLELMAGYIQEMQERYHELATERVQQRIARVLLRLAAQAGRKQQTGVLIDLPFSRQELAEMAGTTLYTVSRVLSAWEKQGLVATGRERVTLTNPHGLVRLAEDLE